MSVQTVKIVEPTDDEQHMVWVLSDGYPRLVDSRPIPASRFDNGHFWLFDHGATDADQPYTCGLCIEAKWKSYNKPCAEGRTPEDLNAERAQWIADNALDEPPVWQVRNGSREAAWPKRRRTVRGGVSA